MDGMKRAKRLVALSLRNHCGNELSANYEYNNNVTKTAEENYECDLISPQDLGYKDLPESSTDFSMVSPDSFSEINLPEISNPLVPTRVPDFNDNNYIENSQDCIFYSYMELQRPAKRKQITIPETPHQSESETDYFDETNTLDNPSPCIQEDLNAVLSTNQEAIANLNNTRNVSYPEPAAADTTNPDLSKKKKKQQRKETLKFPNYSKEERILRSKEKHQILPDHCGLKCRKECHEFDIERRKNIWNSYWNLTHDAQIKWLARYVHLKPVKFSRAASTEKESRRKESRNYFLPHAGGKIKQVCKKMFLNTFGYKNDSILTTLSMKLKEDTTKSLTDKRGTHEKPKIDTVVIKKFINMYKPCIAHYRRHNAPNMKYLGQDISVDQLYKHFKELNPGFKCCKEIIRRTLKDMHISLHRPKSDKCYDCISFEKSISLSQTAKKVPSLKLLSQKAVHKLKAKDAIDAYNFDATREKMVDEKIYSMDLQKSVLLPMMPEVKDCYFTSRMIGFNLTFCGLSKNSKEGSKCMVWHEADGGREGKDIVDAIYALILSDRDVRNLIFWADNCCAQNKNWILFTAPVNIINYHDDRESITIKYLTKGHTHMSADGVHGNIEQNFKKIKNIYDFEDYKNCVQTSRKDNQVIQILPEMKRAWEKKKTTKMEPVMLTDIVEVKFIKGEKFLLYKKSFRENYNKLDFIQKRYKHQELPKLITGRPRGIRTEKKMEIINKLVPLMPQNRREFWTGLPQNDNAVDLITGGQLEPCL